MSNAETIFVVVVALLIVLAGANVLFSLVAEKTNPPMGVFAECDGVRLHYIDRGRASDSCVVLLHGNGAMIQDFAISGLVDLLASDNRVLCFDRPGFGYSERPRSRLWTPTAQAALLVRALDQLGVRNPVVLGHSWGALVAIAVALRTDYKIRGIVLASGYYFPTARLDAWIMSGPAIPVLGDLFRFTLGPLVSWAVLPGLLRKIFAPRAVPREFKDNFPFSLMLRPKQLRAAAEESAFLVPSAAQFQHQYAAIRCPVSIVHGAEDQVIEADQARRLQGVLHHSMLRVVENAGHMVTYADRTAIVEAVAAVGGAALLSGERLDIPS